MTIVRQVDCAEWTDRNFLPGDTLEHRGLILAEEAGEVCRCIVKMAAGVRGTREQWMGELRKELADVQFALYAAAHRAGIDLEEACTERWERIGSLDFKADPIQQGLPAEDDVERDKPMTGTLLVRVPLGQMGSPERGRKIWLIQRWHGRNHGKPSEAGGATTSLITPCLSGVTTGRWRPAPLASCLHSSLTSAGSLSLLRDSTERLTGSGMWSVTCQ